MKGLHDSTGAIGPCFAGVLPNPSGAIVLTLNIWLDLPGDAGSLLPVRTARHRDQQLGVCTPRGEAAQTDTDLRSSLRRS